MQIFNVNFDDSFHLYIHSWFHFCHEYTNKVVRKFLAALKNVISPLIEYEGPLREVFIKKKNMEMEISFLPFHIFFKASQATLIIQVILRSHNSHGLVDTEF